MARQKQVTVFTVAELSDQARERAYVEWLGSQPYSWGSENEAVIKKFAEVFPVTIRDWSYGERGRDYIKWSFIGDDEIRALTGQRLATYLWNSYRTDLFKGKYYSTSKGYVDGKHVYKSRRSKIKLETDCVLTGYAIDNEILQPIYDFMKQPNSHTDFEDLMGECLEAWVTACTSDFEDSITMEQFEDMCEANEWEFYENGRMA